MSDSSDKQELRKVSDLEESEVEEIAAYLVHQCNGGTPFEIAVLLARQRFLLTG